jgi:guanosine-3',5'-bis(diphosphate) 3'-pyrophosphohydrolase
MNLNTMLRGSPLVERAKAFAREKHRHHLRKYTGVPYWTHVEAVADLVAGVTMDAEMIAAALLHDTIEDTDTTYDELVKAFGKRVARLVYEVTNPSMRHPDLNRGLRAAMDREHLACASPEGMTIKLADLIDNTTSIRVYDPDFAKVYLKEKRALLEVLKAGNPTLWKVASDYAKDQPGQP